MPITPVRLDHETQEWLVRQLIDWGYLDASDWLEDDDNNNFESSIVFGHALSRALPRLLLEMHRLRH